LRDKTIKKAKIINVDPDTRSIYVEKIISKAEPECTVIDVEDFDREKDKETVERLLKNRDDEKGIPITYCFTKQRDYDKYSLYISLG